MRETPGPGAGRAVTPTPWDEREVPSPAELRAGLRQRVRRRQVVLRSGLRHRSRYWWRSRQARQRHEMGWFTALQLLLVAATLSAAGVAVCVEDVTATLDAVRLGDRGNPVVVSGSQVHLTRETSKSGRVSNLVDGVRVTYPGGAAAGAELRHIDVHEISPASPSETGWRPATSQTGYAAPFGIHYIVENEITTAMADTDIAQGRSGAVLWRDGLGALALLFVPVIWWTWFPTRLRGRRRTGSRVVGPSRPA